MEAVRRIPGRPRARPWQVQHKQTLPQRGGRCQPAPEVVLWHPQTVHKCICPHSQAGTHTQFTTHKLTKIKQKEQAQKPTDIAANNWPSMQAQGPGLGLQDWRKNIKEKVGEKKVSRGAPHSNPTETKSVSTQRLTCLYLQSAGIKGVQHLIQWSWIYDG